MTPEQLAKSGTEHAHQRALFAWAALNVGNDPRLALMFAIPNGGARDKITAGKLKAEGVKAGVPDIFLPVPGVRWVPPDIGVPIYHGLFIELKKPAVKLKRGPNGPGPWDHGGVSDEQKAHLDALTAQGYKCVVCYSWYEAANQIKLYLTGKGLDE